MLVGVAQLDLFDRIADEDARDAQENGGGDDEDEDGDAERGSASARMLDLQFIDNEPSAVKQMRELVAAVEGNEAVSVELQLLVEKLLNMGGAGGAGGGCCGPELWRKVR